MYPIFVSIVILALSLGTVESGQSCSSSGRTGTCKYTSQCTESSVPGLCPGPSNYHCCINYGTCPGGKCISAGKCSGTRRTGLCPGPSDIQCCTSSAGPGPSPPGLPPPQPAPPRSCRHCNVKFNMRAFIHKDAVVTVDGINGEWFYLGKQKLLGIPVKVAVRLLGNTDNHGFSSGGTSKMEFTKTFSTSTIGRMSSARSAVAGPSKLAYTPPFFGATC